MNDWLRNVKPDPKPMRVGKGRRPRGVNPRAGTAKVKAEACCRICPKTSPLDRHHLVPRSLGGDDDDDNIVPLCHDHHMEFEHGKNRRAIGARIRRSLTRAEVAYMLRKKGAYFIDRYYPKEGA